jgi:hypothetical protein
MSTVISRQTHIEQVLVQVTSLLVERARAQLERDVAAGQESTRDLLRMNELEKELLAIRHELGLPDAAGVSPSPPGRVASRFYEVPGQEDA